MSRLRFAAVAATAGLAAAIAPATAPAAVVGNTSGVRIDFAGEPGEANQVTLTRSGGRIFVTEGNAPLRVQGACTLEQPTPPAVASCPAAGVTELDVATGEGDDEISNASGLGGNLLGGPGRDVVTGGAANERLDGGPGPDVLDGGDGDDGLYGATFQDPAAGADPDVLRGGAGADRLSGSGGADQLDGGPGDDDLNAGGGNDDVRGGDGSDGVVGGGGNDVQDGGPGDDAVGTATTVGVLELSEEIGDDQLIGGPGNDIIVPGPGPPFTDNDAVFGADGVDVVTYAARMQPVDASKDGVANDGSAGERDLVADDVERLTGGLASDVLRGGPGADAIDGGPGDDVLDGRGGHDALRGDGGGEGAGTDTVIGGDGDDTVAGDGGGDTLTGGDGGDELAGGAGEDRATYSTAEDVTVSLQAGTGGSERPADVDTLADVEDLQGGAQRDTFTGSSGPNVLDGKVGEDYVDGTGGVDELSGGGAADVVAARDGVRDAPVACGGGRDLAIVDARDPVVRRGPDRCEVIDDGTRRRPRRGEVHLRPLRCAGDAAKVSIASMRRRVPLRYPVLLGAGSRRRRGPTVDASACTFRVTAPAGRRRSAAANVTRGAAAIAQVGRRRPSTVFTVERPDCSGRAAAAGAQGRRTEVGVSTRRRGRWRVRGRYSDGASRATSWITIERCDSTETVVLSGTVAVFDRERRRTVLVRAGDRYVARERG
jgi:Ca2+-binding RTX toxin-like protein